MAHHKSAIKRIRTNERDRLRNKAYNSALKTVIKKVRTAQSKEEGESLYRTAASMLDKLASKGIIHKNKAANQKSKLVSHISKLG